MKRTPVLPEAMLPTMRSGMRAPIAECPQASVSVARFLVQHNFANGVPISGTEVAIVFGGQIAAKHPRLAWQGDNWRHLLAKIVSEDASWIAGRRRRGIT